LNLAHYNRNSIFDTSAKYFGKMEILTNPKYGTDTGSSWKLQSFCFHGVGKSTP
jgi:hypothetical protein